MSGSKEKLGIFVWKFPSPANTFIFNEVMGLYEKGVDFKIYTFSKESDSDKSFYQDKLKLIEDRIEVIGQKSHNYFNGWYWTKMNKMKIPIAENNSKRLLSIKDKQIRDFMYEISAKRSEKFISPFADKVFLKDGITKMYAPFASLGADVGILLKYHYDVPLHFTCHAYDLFCQFNYGQLKCDLADKIFVISDFNKKYLLSNFNVDSKKIIKKRVNFIPNSEDIEKKDLGYEYILSAGRLEDMKGFKYSIKAFHKLSLLNKDLHYVIAGEGDKRWEIIKLIDELGLNDRVHLVGHVTNKEIISYIKGSLFCVLSSIETKNNDKEGIPTFFIESMSCGVPCIGTKYSGIPELIKNGKNGFLTKEKDVDDIHKKMISLHDLMKSNKSYNIVNNCVQSIEDFDNQKSINVLCKGLKV
tara:strand:+ start:3067 stop:4308 length:1242 start_codon:yes stop_codon:yes gene_type:complete